MKNIEFWVIFWCFLDLSVDAISFDNSTQSTRHSSSLNIPRSEFNALYSLYNSTNGVQWNWQDISQGNIWNFTNLDANPCVEQWQGILCMDENICDVTINDNYNHIVSLQLISYKMIGSLPDELFNIMYMCQLQLSDNKLTGSIPDVLGTLNDLNFLDLSVNIPGMTGTIPSSITNCIKLEYIVLSYNQFSGSLPVSIGQLTKLSKIDVFFNKLTGTIPDSLYSLASMVYLFATHNQLIGSISDQIGQLRNLQQIYVAYNQLTGSLPNSITSCTHLTTIDLSYNQLTGSIPSNVGSLVQLSTIYLEENLLDGSLPLSLYDLTDLATLNLQTNLLTGSLSNRVGDLSKLLFLELFANLMTHTLPNSIGLLSALYYCELQGNSFSGTIPAALGQLSSVFYLQLDTNLLTGSIPLSITNCTALIVLTLNNNLLTGTIPTEIGRFQVDASKLFNSLALQNNILSGSIPSSITSLRNLNFIYLQNNQLTGLLPRGLNTLQFLIQIQVSGNSLSGQLGDCGIADMSRLETLFVNDNTFTGPLDGVFNSSSQLQLINVDLSDNRLTGRIPSEPFHIPTLQSFAAVGNCFSGRDLLPVEAMCGATSLITLALDGLMSAPSCQKRFFPVESGIDSYALPSDAISAVPSCLLELPRLSILHLSGSGFSGSLSQATNVSRGLTDLSLSNNNIKGAIPDSLQYRQWINLDLSFNKLTGTLRTAYSPLTDNDTLSLQVNRLSGNIPSSLQSAQDISVLDGNLFACSADRSNLPQGDADRADYECGSSSFNASMYLWTALVGSAIAVTLVAWWWSLWSNNDLWVNLRRYLAVFDTQNVVVDSPLSEFGSVMRQLRLAVCVLTGLTVCGVLPVALLLGNWYATYTHRYAYTLSLAYLSGVAPAITLLFVLIALYLACWIIVRNLSADVQVTGTAGMKSSVTWMHYSSYTLLVVLLDMCVMLAVNVGFVLVNQRFGSFAVQLAQLAVALFKILWNETVIRYVLRISNDAASSRSTSTSHVSLAVFTILFNNLAAPFLANAYINSNCLYSLFYTQNSVSVSYLYMSCMEYVKYGNNKVKCLDYRYGADPRETSYTPPFNYSYECSSSLITTYSSVYVFMFILATFKTPLLHWVSLFILKRADKEGWLHRLVRKNTPEILYPRDSSRRSESPLRTSLLALVASSDRVFDLDMFVAQLASLIGVALAFGVVVPPVMAVGCVAVCAFTYRFQLYMGRYVCMDEKRKTSQSANELVDVLQLALADGGDKRSMSNRASHDTSDDGNERLASQSSSSARSTQSAVDLVQCDVLGARVKLRRALLIVAPFVLLIYCFLLFDILGDAVGWEQAMWLPLTVVIAACCLCGGVFYVQNKCWVSDRSVSTSFTDRGEYRGIELDEETTEGYRCSDAEI